MQLSSLYTGLITPPCKHKDMHITFFSIHCIHVVRRWPTLDQQISKTLCPVKLQPCMQMCREAGENTQHFISQASAWGSQQGCLKFVWSNREYAAPLADATAYTPHCTLRQPYTPPVNFLSFSPSLLLFITVLCVFFVYLIFSRFYFWYVFFSLTKHAAITSDTNLIWLYGCRSFYKNILNSFGPVGFSFLL